MRKLLRKFILRALAAEPEPWHHWEATFDETGHVECFVDGQRVSDGEPSGTGPYGF